jgi:hypothetical protein
MGVVYLGIPVETTKWLKKKLKLDVFLEGGTYLGRTAKEMSQFFDHVFTIEKSASIFDLAKKNLESENNVTLLNGDTREHLHRLLDENDNLLIWLDAHWSGGNTYGVDDECPILKELEIIFNFKKNFVILIDDARLFLSPPPQPHKIENWPTYLDIMKTFPSNWESIVFEDVIYIFPNKISENFNEMIQQKNTRIHLKWVKSRSSIFYKIKNFFKLN